MSAVNCAQLYIWRARACVSLVVCINIYYYTSIAKKSDYTLLIYTGKASSLPAALLATNKSNQLPQHRQQHRKNQKKVIINAGIPLVDESTSFFLLPPHTDLIYQLVIIIIALLVFLRVCVLYLILRPQHTHVRHKTTESIINPAPDIRLNVIYPFPSLRWDGEKMESVRVIFLLLLLLRGPSIRVASSASADL